MQLKTATLGESKASKEVSNLVLKIILAIMGVGGMVLGVTFVASGAVYADGGGWTGSGTAVTPSGTPGGTFGGWSCSGDNAYYILGCTGFSWVYYRYVGGSAGRGRSITFRPYNNNSNGGYVSGACARTDGGFWHFGRNARGFPYGGYASYNYVYGRSSATSVYWANPGKWGHMETYTYGTYVNYAGFYDWSHTPSGSAYYMPGNLGQTLYRKIDGKYVKMYEAVRMGNVRTVLANYKSAYKFSNGTNYTGAALPAGVYAFCYWEGMENTEEFQGRTASGSTSTGWQSKDTTKKRTISNCAVTGCDVKFEHALKRVSGTGSTRYRVSRESNYWVSKKSLGVAPNSNLKSGTEQFTGVQNGTGVVEYTEELKLVPGQVVCEAITFRIMSNVTDTATTRVCVSALGKAQPGTGADALLNMEVKNGNVANYNDYQKEVYAKPGDELTFRATYNPVLQYTYYLVPQAMKITCGSGATKVYENSGGARLGALFNNYRAKCDSGLGTWKNGFSVESSGFTMTTIDYDGYTVGDTTRREETNSHTVASAEVGRKLTENARTNLNDKIKTTPSQVTFTDGTKGNTGNVVTTDQVSNAAALIPYNFINTTEITAVDRTLFYAGEEAKVSYRVDVNEKRNDVTDGTYATIVRGAKWRLEVCMDGMGDYHETAEGTGNIAGRTKTVNATIAIPDVRAGSEICLRSGVYPANSGADTNWEDAKGSNTWQYSEWRCFKVAKRPSLQVWGGNVYSGGKIQTGVSIKNNLTGVTEYNVGTKNANNYVFGSWGELGVISVGAVTGFASGAGTGYDLGSLEAVNNTRFSLRSTLTFANYPNGATMVSGLGSNNGTIKNAIQGHKSRMMENLINAENEQVSVFLDEAEFLNGDNLIKVFYRKGDIRITNNIIYGGGSYSKFSEMPKNVVYAEGGSIIISCDVGRIDAVLVADREVRTCDSDDVDAEANSRPLRINGAIIADRLVANRTYGAATGVNSIVPAEVVNFDPTLYLWGNYREETEEVRDFMTTYMHEVAPRL